MNVARNRASFQKTANGVAIKTIKDVFISADHQSAAPGNEDDPRGSLLPDT